MVKKVKMEQKFKDKLIYYSFDKNQKDLVLFHNQSISIYNRFEDCINFYKNENFDGLIVENKLYYNQNNLEVLKYFKNLKRLRIDNDAVTNFDGLKYLINLESLVIQNTSISLDFDKYLSNLKKLSLESIKGVNGLDKLNHLEKLHITSDDDNFKLPSNLNYLALYKSKRTNLSFTKEMKYLQNLDLNFCNQISSLDEISKTLKEVTIYRCKNLPFKNLKANGDIIINFEK